MNQIMFAALRERGHQEKNYTTLRPAKTIPWANYMLQSLLSAFTDISLKLQYILFSYSSKSPEFNFNFALNFKVYSF